jgi:hypothetical protein
MILTKEEIAMTNLNYRNFDLKIWRTDDGYCAQVQSLDAGESSSDFTLPFSKDKLESLLAKLGPGHQVRNFQTHDLEAAKTLGGGLYKMIFTQNIGNSLSRSMEAASQKGERLRIRLWLSAVPELANLPWEFLYDELARRFLALQYKTSIVRYLELPEKIPVLAVKPPLRLLVMASRPHGYDPLSVEKEWENLQIALGKVPKGLIEVERLKTATLSALQTRLSQGTPCHIFHFIGHGGFDARTGKSVLVMEDKNRNASFVDGNRLSTLLYNYNSLRLILLNACEGAVANPNDTFSGMAQSLMQCEIPAVIAMQFEISDNAAVTFASGFYEAVARGNPVDAAMLDARLAIFAETNSVEWGTPVLYLRAPDGRIFDTDLREFEAESAQPTLPQIMPGASSEPESATIKPVLPPAEPKGSLHPKSAFYIERPTDNIALDLISYPDFGKTLVIQASGQMGGSSLLRRVMDAAKRANKRVAHIDFQNVFDPEDLDNSEDFHRRFCAVLSDRLDKDNRVDHFWERYKSLSIGDRCTKYVRYLLQSLGDQHLVLVMDEMDRLIAARFRSSFFGMVRSWQGERAMDEHFERLDLVILTSLEPNQLIGDHNQSPFNVSTEIRLSDFLPVEIRKLCDLYGVNPTVQQLESLFAFIGGHPYLWQLSLHQVAKGVYTFEQLLLAAKKGDEPYRPHLSAWYEFLQNKPDLREALTQILSRREYNESAFLSLRRTGLVSREGNQVRLRCKLYEDYFREQLYV